MSDPDKVQNVVNFYRKQTSTRKIKMDKLKIQICTGTYKGQINPQTQALIKALLKSEVHEFTFSGHASPYTDLCRNEAICPSPLQRPELPDVNGFFLLDADNIPTEEQVYQNIEEWINGGYDILGMVYHKNSTLDDYCVSIQGGASETKLFKGVIPVYTMGFGGAMVTRNLLSIMPKPWFNTYFTTDNEQGTWRHIPEDENFCIKARALGFRVYCNFDILIKHDIVPPEEIQKRMLGV